MIPETVIGAVLAATGFFVLLPVRKDVPAWARIWLSIPTGIAVYLITAVVLIIVTGTLTPEIALGITTGLGVLAFGFVALRDRSALGDLRWAGYSIGIAVMTVMLTRVLHLTRLSPDSLRYLLAANDLVLPDALEEIHQADLLIRQIGLPALHGFSDLVDRRYVASIAPLFGVFGLGFFTWLSWLVTAGMAKRSRWWLVAGALAFLGSSNRLVYDAFYINTHIQMSVFLLIAVAGSWLAVSKGMTGFAWPAGMALAGTLVMRPEAPLVAAIVLVTVAASRAGWRVRWALVTPPIVVMVLWYGIVLWQYARRGDQVSLTAPVFGSLVAMAGAVAVMILGGFERARPVVKRLDLIALGGLALLVAGYGLRNTEVVTASLQATFRNLTFDGLWLITWLAALSLLAVAFVVQRIPDSRMWAVPIVGFGLLYWLLPLIRDGAYRVGAGDSGNRILAHILAVVVAFLVLAAVDIEKVDEARDDIEATGPAGARLEADN